MTVRGEDYPGLNVCVSIDLIDTRIVSIDADNTVEEACEVRSPSTCSGQEASC